MLKILYSIEYGYFSSKFGHLSYNKEILLEIRCNKDLRKVEKVIKDNISDGWLLTNRYVTMVGSKINTYKLIFFKEKLIW